MQSAASTHLDSQRQLRIDAYPFSSSVPLFLLFFLLPHRKLYAKNMLLPVRRFQKRGYPCLLEIFSMRLRGLANLDVDLMPK